MKKKKSKIDLEAIQNTCGELFKRGKTMKPKNNEELKKLVKNNVLNCEGQDLICDFSIDINADIINARDINARDIKAWNVKARAINAWNINSGDINARDISYYAICFAYNNIICKSIKGRRKNSKHFCLDGKVQIKK